MNKLVGPESSDTSQVLHLSGVDSYRKYDTYTYAGVPVPRVTQILDSCFSKSQIIRWAATIGLDEYQRYRKESLTVGTLAHEQIENFMNGVDVSTSHINNPKYADMVSNCINNYIDFFIYLSNSAVKISPLYTEESITTPWYGGTIDCIAKISFPNGFSENIIIDYKTSKNISIEYIMQTYAYMWATNWTTSNGGKEYPKIDGIMIIRVNKNGSGYEYILMDIYHNTYDFIELEQDLGNMINWFYSQINLKSIMKTAKQNKITEESFYGSFCV